MSAPGSSGAGKENTKWSDKHDETHFQYMLEAKREGLDIPNGFSNEGWNQISRKMTAQFGPKFKKDKCKNRRRTYRRWYDVMKRLLDQSGFKWSEKTRMIMAAPDVWEDYIRVHPEASHYRNRRLPNYGTLAELLGGSVADGRCVFATNDEVPTEFPPDNTQGEGGDNDVESQPIDQPMDEAVREEHVSTTSGQSAEPQVPSHQISRRRSASDLMVEAVTRMSDALGKLAETQDRLASSHDRMARTKERMANLQDPVWRLRSCWEALGDIELDEMSKVKAFTLFQNDIAASTFLALPPAARKLWLLPQIQSPSV